MRVLSFRRPLSDIAASCLPHLKPRIKVDTQTFPRPLNFLSPSGYPRCVQVRRADQMQNPVTVPSTSSASLQTNVKKEDTSTARIAESVKKRRRKPGKQGKRPKNRATLQPEELNSPPPSEVAVPPELTETVEIHDLVVSSSALATARFIDDFRRVCYPENIQSPSVNLNLNAKDGKFRYDRDFLLQFRPICKQKLAWLTPPDALNIDAAKLPSDFMLMRGKAWNTQQPSRGAQTSARNTQSVSESSMTSINPPRPPTMRPRPPKAGDLSTFGKIGKNVPAPVLPNFKQPILRTAANSAAEGGEDRG
ncbi:hypothetical protein R3P38DRAFT_1184976 [Favolaschia claudopus]|uniref:Eukaryotic translation initiation factor 4G1 eIF4E-binding domain-containing protein n=1 Tax=Favolaschia claudopus TaxID=2862362 RepID=A0AAW0DXF1_9AGAR